MGTKARKKGEVFMAVASGFQIRSVRVRSGFFSPRRRLVASHPSWPLFCSPFAGVCDACCTPATISASSLPRRFGPSWTWCVGLLVAALLFTAPPRALWVTAQVNEVGQEWTLISKAVNRLPNTIRNVYVRHCAQQQGKWSPAEDDKLIAAVKARGCVLVCVCVLLLTNPPLCCCCRCLLLTCVLVCVRVALVDSKNLNSPLPIIPWPAVSVDVGRTPESCWSRWSQVAFSRGIYTFSLHDELALIEDIIAQGVEDWLGACCLWARVG